MVGAQLSILDRDSSEIRVRSQLCCFLSYSYLNTLISIPNARTASASRGFRDIQKEVVLIPTGTWHPDPNVQKVGSLVSRNWALAWQQLGPMMVEEGGLSPEEADEVTSSAIEELKRTECPIVVKYHIIYGTKM